MNQSDKGTGPRQGTLESAWRRTASSPATTAMVIVVLWVSLIAGLSWLRYDGDLSGFLYLGSRFERPPTMAGMTVAPGWGYDGQFYGVLATDPLLLEEPTSTFLDAPSYRARRILLPLLAWTVTLGRSPASVYAYLLLVWGMGLAGGIILCFWLAREGACPWWALVLTITCGSVTSMLRGTPDAAATGLIVASLALAGAGRWKTALVAIVMACLARETSMLAALALAIGESAQGRRFRAAVVVCTPVFVLVGWTLWLRSQLAELNVAGSSSNLDLPFRAMVDKIWALATSDAPVIEVLATGGVMAAIVASLALLPIDTKHVSLKTAYLLFAGLTAVLGPNVWAEINGYGRALGILPVLGVMASVATQPRRRWLLCASALICAAAGMAMIFNELAPAIPMLTDLKGWVTRTIHHVH